MRGSSGAPRRWLKLAAVADLMRVEHTDPHYRVQYVRRLLRRLEERDGTAYLRRFGAGRGNLYVSPAALEQLDPYSPGAVGKIKDEVTSVKADQGELRRQVNAHGARILSLEKFRRATQAFVKELAAD